MNNRYKITFRSNPQITVEASYFLLKEGLAIFRLKSDAGGTDSSTTMVGAYNIEEVFSITIEDE